MGLPHALRAPRFAMVTALCTAALAAGAAGARTVSPPQAAAAGDAAKIDAVASLFDLKHDVTDKVALAGMGWARFLANGCKGGDECLAATERGESHVALADAIEKAVKSAVDGMVGKKLKVKLNDAVDAPLVKVGDEGFTVNVNKVETLVLWADVDPKNLAILVSRGKPTADPELAAIATLRLLSGEIGDAKKQSTKLTSDLGKRLGELVDISKALLPEVKSARALESALRDPDAARALEKMKAAWGEAKATKVGEGTKARLHEQYVARGTKAFAGQKALDGLIHGKVTLNPAKASPAAGPGGVGLEIEYEFEKDSEGLDFDAPSLPVHLKNLLRNWSKGSGEPAPFKVTQSRLNITGVNGGILPIEFAGDLEIESVGGLSENWQGKPTVPIAVGCSTQDGNELAAMVRQCALETVVAGKQGKSAKKDFNPKDIHAGMQCDTVLKIAGGKATLALNGDVTDPVEFGPKNPLRVWVLAAGTPDWYIERLVVRGTATGQSMADLARLLAERQATALFGG